MRLPDTLTLFLLLTAEIFSPVEPTSRVAGMLGAAGLLFAVAVVFRWCRGVDGLGFGDVKLAAGCGAWVGLAHVGPLLLVSAILALLGALWTTHGDRAASCVEIAPTRTEAAPAPSWTQVKIAFGPYLCLGTAVTAVASSIPT